MHILEIISCIQYTETQIKLLIKYIAFRKGELNHSSQDKVTHSLIASRQTPLEKSQILIYNSLKNVS